MSKLYPILKIEYFQPSIMAMQKSFLPISIVFVLAFTSFLSDAQVTLILRKSFIDSIKDHITYKGSFLIAAAAEKPKSPKSGGELYISLKDGSIGLPVVAKIANAKDAEIPVNKAQTNSQDKPLTVKGVWTLWPEPVAKEKLTDPDDEQIRRRVKHTYNTKKYVQGSKFSYNTPNPPHIFELNPIMDIGGIVCISTMKRIEGYEYQTAEEAFKSYSELNVSLTDRDDYIEILAPDADNTYPEFWLKPLNFDQKVVEDGRFVYCDIYNKKGNIIANDIRVGFPAGSDAEKGLINLKNNLLHIAGVPRINLSEISKNLQGASMGTSVSEPMPVEIIATALLEQF